MQHVRLRPRSRPKHEALTRTLLRMPPERKVPRRQHGTVRGEQCPRCQVIVARRASYPIYRSGVADTGRKKSCATAFPANRGGNQPGPWPPSHEIQCGDGLAGWLLTTPRTLGGRIAEATLNRGYPSLPRWRNANLHHMPVWLAQESRSVRNVRHLSAPGLLTGVTYDTEIWRFLVV